MTIYRLPADQRNDPNGAQERMTYELLIRRYTEREDIHVRSAQPGEETSQDVIARMTGLSLSDLQRIEAETWDDCLRWS